LEFGFSLSPLVLEHWRLAMACESRVNHPLAQEYDVLAILDHFGDETHAVACGAKNSTIP
jgi:hypothetical protein